MAVSTFGNNTGQISGTDDTKLRQLSATTNYDGTDAFEATKYVAGDHTHGLIRFTGISAIPASATITAVSLFVVKDGGFGADPYRIDMRRMIANWVVGQATWNELSTGVSWNTAGALGAATDRVATSSANVPVFDSGDAVGTAYEFSGAGLVADVQAWVSGTATNNGWHLEATPTGDEGFRVFATSENSDGSRPYLVVTYTTVPPPELRWMGRRWGVR